MLGSNTKAGHKVRCSECCAEIPAGTEFHWDRAAGTTCQNCAKETSMVTTLNENIVRGMAAGIEIAETDEQIVVIAEAFESHVGTKPSISLGMDYDAALEALMDSIEDENALKDEDEKVEVVEPAVDVAAEQMAIDPIEEAEPEKPKGGAIESEKDDRDLLADFDW